MGLEINTISTCNKINKYKKENNKCMPYIRLNFIQSQNAQYNPEVSIYLFIYLWFLSTFN